MEFFLEIMYIVYKFEGMTHEQPKIGMWLIDRYSEKTKRERAEKKDTKER